MRILFLTPRLPHAGVISGDRLAYERIRRLVLRGHEIGLASFARPDEQHLVDGWRPHVLDIETHPAPDLARRGTALARRMATPFRLPVPFGEWHCPRMMRTVGDLVERSRYQAVIAEYSEMGQYLYRNPYLPSVRRVISCHQSPFVASQKRCELLGYGVKGLAERVHRDRLRDYEFRLYRDMDRVLVLTPQESYQIMRLAPDVRTAVVPNGVDTEWFAPPPRRPKPEGIIYTGFYSHEPNRDAVQWFCAQVWPKIRARHPSLIFFVVGPDPSPELQHLAWKDPHIVVTGPVADIRPYLARSALFVCPVRMGSGMRGKILEAMASGLPVVSTSLGVEGIPIQPGGNCVLADHPDVMASNINLLLDDPALRNGIAQRALETADRFSWERNEHRLLAVLEDVVRRRG